MRTEEIRPSNFIFISEKEMVTHSGILAWIIPWTEEPDGLQSLGLQRVGHESVTEYKAI